MGVLESDQARSALGERLADRFLQYATTSADGDAQHLLLRVDEHLAEVLHAARRGGEQGPLAERLAVTCKRLLLRHVDTDPQGRAAIIGAVRYFLETHDLSRDDQKAGLDDDARVLAYVVGAVAPDLAFPLS